MKLEHLIFYYILCMVYSDNTLMEISDIGKKKYWQESWFATIVIVLLTWFAAFLLGVLGFSTILVFIIFGILFLFTTRGTNQREVLAWRLLVKRSMLINGIVIVIVVISSFLPLMISN